MRKLLIVIGLLAAPAQAVTLEQRIDRLPPEERVFQLLNAVDKAVTYDCVHRGVCREANPLLGHSPSAAKLAGAAIIGGAAHAMVTSLLQDAAPGLAKPWEYVTIVAQGSVVALNLRFTFK